LISLVAFVATNVIEDEQVDKSDFYGRAQLGMDPCLRRDDGSGAGMKALVQGCVCGGRRNDRSSEDLFF
jgi:hypothetical protein